MSVQIDTSGIRLYPAPGITYETMNLTTDGTILTHDGNIYINANTTGEATLFMRASGGEGTFDTTKTAVIGINEQGVGIKEGVIIIDNNDNVGIGYSIETIDSIDYSLDVDGTFRSTSDILCEGSLFVSEQILIDNDVINVRPLEVTGNATNIAKFVSKRDSSFIEINNKKGTRALFGCDGSGFGGGVNTTVLLANWSDGNLEFATNQIKRMTIDKVGNVGIGTTSPSYPLHVTKTVNEANSGYNKYYQGSGDNVKYQTSIETYQISIWATGNIATEKHYLQISDRRIKQNIQEIDDETALSQLRQLKPCKYTYIDAISRTNREVIGFIAQEVKDVIPHAVSDSNTQIIPSIYSFSNCSVISPKEIQIEHTDIENITLSDRIQFYAPNVSTEFIGNVTNISTEDQTYTLTLDDTLDNVSASNVFVYGKEVNDFHLMAKEHIFTVATAAIQELDRQVQNLTIEKAKLQDQITNLTLEYQTRLESLEARLAALES